MPKLTFPISYRLVDFVAAFPDETAESYGYEGPDEHDGESLLEHVRGYVSHGRGLVDAFLRQAGFYFDEHHIMVHSAEALHRAANLFMLVQFEYDEYPVSPEREAIRTKLGYKSPVWYILGLGGDDDVDYNGTHPSMMTDLLLQLTSED